MSGSNAVWREAWFESDDGARLFFRHRVSEREGSQPVVLLHSLFFDNSMFDAVASLLPDEFELICPDHRGQGASQSGQDLPSMERLGRDAVALIEQVTRKPVHVVGSSMGGYVALSLLSTRPDLLATCTLSCCTAKAEQQVERFAALEASIRENGPASMVDTLMNTMFGEQFINRNSSEPSLWRERFSVLTSDVADAVHGVFSRSSYDAVLDAVDVPLLLFSGSLDRAKRPEDMAAIAQRVADSRHIVIDGAGHTPPIETPTLFAEELIRFWREHEPHQMLTKGSEFKKVDRSN